jgi:hypothetical protein
VYHLCHKSFVSKRNLSNRDMVSCVWRDPSAPGFSSMQELNIKWLRFEFTDG